MITRRSVRRKSRELFEKVIKLRKSGNSYGEIRKETGLAKSTINNWITYAGLNLSKEHLQIQISKREQNHIIGTTASKITRSKRREEDINKFIQDTKRYLGDPFFVAGIMLYEAEGSKLNNNFSNSNYKLILTYVKFIEKYFLLDRNKDLGFRIYIHDSRADDLSRIKNFWATKLNLEISIFRLSWKHNVVSVPRLNLNYVGQLGVNVRGVSHFSGKMRAVSDIMLSVFEK